MRGKSSVFFVAAVGLLSGSLSAALAAAVEKEAAQQRRFEWKSAEGAVEATLVQKTKITKDSYSNVVEIEPRNRGRFELSHEYSNEIGGDRYRFREVGSGWVATLSARIHVPGGITLPPPEDFDGMSELLDREGVVIEWEFETPSGLLWQFDESGASKFPDSPEELRASILRYAAETGVVAEIPASVREGAELLLSRATTASDLAGVFRTIGKVILAAGGEEGRAAKAEGSL